MPQLVHGEIDRFFPERSYGFVLGDDGTEYFLHVNNHFTPMSMGDDVIATNGHHRLPRRRDRVVFEAGKGNPRPVANQWTYES